MLKKHSQFLASLFVAIDVLIIALSWAFAYYIRFSEFWWHTNLHSQKYLILLFPIILLCSFIFKNMGLYRQRRITPLPSEVFDIVKASTLSVIILVSATYFIRKDEFSRLVFFYFWLISIFLLSTERLILRKLLWFFRRKGLNIRRVLIVGASDLGIKVLKKFKHNPWTGLEVIGLLDDQMKTGETIEEIKVLGRISSINKIIDEQNIDQVFIALPIQSYKKMMYVVNRLSDKTVTVRIIPDLYQTITLNAGVEEFDGMPIINLSDTPMYGWSVIVKRAMDIIFSLLAILLTSPLMSIIAILIKVTSPGPVLYRQERMGLDGKTFGMLKFRSMRVDAEDKSGAVWAKEDDPRKTKLGSFLRKTSLDELPQFLNVLKGDMSIVGPRPERPVFIREFKKEIPKYMLRHKMKAGITGWAQINGWRGNTSLKKRIECDIYYIEHWSVWLDLKIMWLTVWKGLINKHAY